MTKWEYSFSSQKVDGRYLEDKEVADLLKARGMEGWELVAIDYGSFIFKRPLVLGV